MMDRLHNGDMRLKGRDGGDERRQHLNIFRSGDVTARWGCVKIAILHDFRVKNPDEIDYRVI